MKDIDANTLSCPIPISDYPHVLLAHGGGGKLMHNLIVHMFQKNFANDISSPGHDGAVFSVAEGRLAFTTDSYVVSPLFFPGGDIGSLAVNGTVNDLAMCGARPLYLSMAFIIEEGLPMETLWRVVRSMSTCASSVGVKIVTGDTKVVNKGKGDCLFITAAGVGVLEHEQEILPQSIKAGDTILVSGDLGRHGIAIMGKREGLSFAGEVRSDCAPLWAEVKALLDSGIEIHCLRDLTRGGLASCLVELAEASNLGFEIDEKAVSVTEAVYGACELLGFDPMYVANEGRMVVFVPTKDAHRALQLLRGYNESANLIGTASNEHARMVIMKSRIGTKRIVDMISGEQLPRIC